MQKVTHEVCGHNSKCILCSKWQFALICTLLLSRPIVLCPEMLNLPSKGVLTSHSTKFELCSYVCKHVKWLTEWKSDCVPPAMP